MTAITSETFRGALKSIAAEQHDACVALGLTMRVKVFYVVFPQACCARFHRCCRTWSAYSRRAL